MPTKPTAPNATLDTYNTSFLYEYGQNFFITMFTIVPNAASYKVYYSTVSATATKNFLFQGTSSVYEDGYYNMSGAGCNVTPGNYYDWFSNALPNTNYYVWITAVNKAGESDFSPVVSTKTGPAIPTNVTAVAQSASSIKISWPAVTGATSYKVIQTWDPYWNENVLWEIATVTTTTYTHTQLWSKTRYWYSVVAVNASGKSGLSTDVSATTP